MQWIVAPDSTTHRRRLLDDLGRLLRLDRLHDESSLTFMHGGERSGSSGGGFGIVDGTPSVSMHAAIITERNKGVFMNLVMGNQSIQMRLRAWNDVPAHLSRLIQRRGRSSARSPVEYHRRQHGALGAV